MVGLFVAAPLLALLPAFVFGLLFWRTHRRSPLVAAIAWLAYTFYEEAMRRRILCSGECNIRVDLLLLYPVLSLSRWWHRDALHWRRGQLPRRG